MRVRRVGLRCGQRLLSCGPGPPDSMLGQEHAEQLPTPAALGRPSRPPRQLEPRAGCRLGEARREPVASAQLGSAQRLVFAVAA